MNSAKIMLFDGRIFDLLNPDPALLDIDVIARSLSRQCRFNGHADRFYSVAEHCVLVSQISPPHLALWGLLHDAAETFVGDMVSPLKAHDPIFQSVEAKIDAAIMHHFGVWRNGWRGDFAAEVKRADRVALATEAAQLMSVGTYWQDQNLPEAITTEWPLGMSMQAAENAFLHTFRELHR